MEEERVINAKLVQVLHDMQHGERAKSDDAEQAAEISRKLLQKKGEHVDSAELLREDRAR